MFRLFKPRVNRQDLQCLLIAGLVAKQIGINFDASFDGRLHLKCTNGEPEHQALIYATAGDHIAQENSVNPQEQDLALLAGRILREITPPFDLTTPLKQVRRGELTLRQVVALGTSHTDSKVIVGWINQAIINARCVLERVR